MDNNRQGAKASYVALVFFIGLWLILPSAVRRFNREAFAEFLASLPTGITDLDQAQRKAFALESFAAMTDSLVTGRALTAELIFQSIWNNVTKTPERRFGPLQYVEMPFYNQPMFDLAHTATDILIAGGDITITSTSAPTSRRPRLRPCPAMGWMPCAASPTSARRSSTTFAV